MKKTLPLLVILFFATQSFGQWVNNNSFNNIVANTPLNDNDPIAVSDGAGGSINIFASGNNDDLFAQKITSAAVVAWGSTTNPVLICNAPGYKYSYKAIADGSGGAYIAWYDTRDGSAFGSIYIQHINAAGAVLWVLNGVRVSDSMLRDDYEPAMCSDGSGGVITCFSGDDLVSNIQMYAQRYNAAGMPQWTAGGVQVCTAPGFRGGTSIVADNNNGAIIFFTDTRNDVYGLNFDSLYSNDLTNADIYAQRLNGNGNRLWTNDGVAVCTAPGNQDAYDDTKAVPDGFGGASIAFTDGRNDPVNNYDNIDIFAQRVNSAGVLQWAAAGVAVCTAPNNQFGSNNFVVPDGSGGVVVAWEDEDSSRVFIQKIVGAGTPAWTHNGIKVSIISANYGSGEPSLVNDSLGNHIVIYGSYTAAFHSEITAQKLNSSGVKQWANDGIMVAYISETRTGGTNVPTVVLSDNGSVIASWSARADGFMTNAEIYASKVLATGVLAGSPPVFVTIANGNWNNSAIWMGGVVPYPLVSATVRHQVNVIEDAACYSLKVEQPNGNVTVKAGKNLTILH